VSSKEYHFRNLLSKRVLIVGEVGTGKTALTAHLIRKAVEAGLEEQITILDLAPKVIIQKGRKISGRVRDLISLPRRIRHLTSDKIRAPRIKGRSREEVISYAQQNREVIERLFDKFTKTPTPILFVNDVTLCLHLGDIGRLKEVFSKAETVIINAYEGTILQDDLGSGISDREKAQVNQLKDWVDVIIKTGRPD